MKDIYNSKVNLVIFVDEDKHDIVEEILSKGYNVKQKGMHSPKTTDKVDYWYSVRPGVFAFRLLSIDRFYNRDHKVPLWQYKKYLWRNVLEVLRKLNKCNIKHEIYHVVRKES